MRKSKKYYCLNKVWHYELRIMNYELRIRAVQTHIIRLNLTAMNAKFFAKSAKI